MGIEENKEVVKSFLEAASNIQGDLKKINTMTNTYFAPEFIQHSSHGDINLDTSKETLPIAYSAFPDIKHEIHDIIAEGDKVVVRMTTFATHKGYLGDIPPTNKKISYSVTDIFRVYDGKIHEEWALSDFFSMFQQLGTYPPLPEEK